MRKFKASKLHKQFSPTHFSNRLSVTNNTLDIFGILEIFGPFLSVTAMSFSSSGSIGFFWSVYNQLLLRQRPQLPRHCSQRCIVFHHPKFHVCEWLTSSQSHLKKSGEEGGQVMLSSQAVKYSDVSDEALWKHCLKKTSFRH